MHLPTLAVAASLFCFSAAAAMAGPVGDAAKAGDLAALATALGSDGAIEERNASAETPLIIAALAGRTDVVLDLIKRGADVNARNDRGMTALHAATYAGDLPAVEALLAAGVPVDEAGNKFKVTPLFVAAEENHIDIVSLLLDRGAAIEQTEAHGYTVLTRSAYKEHDAIIALLIKRGAVCQEVDPVWQKECTKRKAALGL
jgi:uncharacterized protein